MMALKCCTQYVSRFGNETILTHYQPNPYFIQISLHNVLFSTPGFQPGQHITFPCSVFTRLLLTVIVSYFLCFWSSKSVLKSTDQIFCRMSLCWNLVFFLMSKQYLCIHGRKTTGIKCNSHHTIFRCHIKLLA